MQTTQAESKHSNGAVHSRGNNLYEDIICFDARKLRNGNKRSHDLQGTYSVQSLSPSMLTRARLRVSIHTHTQRTDGATYNRTGSAAASWTNAREDLTLTLSVSLLNKSYDSETRCLCTDSMTTHCRYAH